MVCSPCFLVEGCWCWGVGEWFWELTREVGREMLMNWGNTGAAAAQVVPHVHFHIIPRPALTPELRNKSFTMFGRGQRSEIDDDEAAELAKNLREELIRQKADVHSKAKL